MGRLLLSFLVTIAATTALASTIEYVDLAESRPDDGTVQLLSTGSKFSSFERDGPFVLDPQFNQEYGSLGYLHVHFQPNGDNSYNGESSQYVASIKDASVCGSEGDVWDSQGRLYRMNTWVRHPISKLEAWRDDAQKHGVKHFKRLASSVHRVSFMYYHFMVESLPAIAKFAPYLAADPEMKLLTYGSPFEAAWIEKLGIRSEQLVTFEPLFAYHADELLVSNPVEIARTPREDLEMLLAKLNIPAPLPESERTDLVYVSRRLAADRIQTNEDALLKALEVEAAAQGLRLVVHDGNPSLTADDSIAMFRRARAVMGANGAGLAHMLFAPPGTVLVELMFVNNTGMDQWHLTAALHQKYYMVPLPRSHWLDPGSDVPVEQAVSTLRWALGKEKGAEPACPAGAAPGPDGVCASCPAGTFATGYDGACQPCTAGWVSERMGAGFCHICLPNSFAASATACTPCPAGTVTAMPGSTSADECMAPAAVEEIKRTWLPTDQVVAKVSAYYQAIAKRRSAAEDKLQFHALPEGLKDRILSELDSCSSYKTYSTYGCYAPPSPPPSPPTRPPAAPFATFTGRALGAGPLTGCVVSYLNPDWDMVVLPSKTDSLGFVPLNLSSLNNLAAVSLVNCSEPSLNRTNFSTRFVLIGIPSNATAVVSPIAEVASFLDPEDGEGDLKDLDFFGSYSKVAKALGVPVSMYGGPANLTNFDYFAATFNSSDTAVVTKGTLVYMIQSMVHGMTDVWASGLAGTNFTESDDGKLGMELAYTGILYAIYDTVQNTTTTSTINMSSPDVQSKIGKLAVSLGEDYDYSESDGEDDGSRRRLLQAGVSSDDLNSALSSSLATSVATQTAGLATLAGAVNSGTGLSAGDLASILTAVVQATQAQRMVAVAAAQLAAGTLSLASFKAQYTGDALLALIASIEVDLNLQVEEEKDKHIGAIVGGVIGGFFGLLLIIVLVVILVRRRNAHVQPKQQQQQPDEENKAS